MAHKNRSLKLPALVKQRGPHTDQEPASAGDGMAQDDPSTQSELWATRYSKPRSVRRYSNTLTADVNGKGVLDVDTVKGCSAGMEARPDGGCYNACYAATIAKFRGIDFATSVVRVVHSASHAKRIEKAVRAAPHGFFRVGTMGDPSLAWAHTVRIIEWLATLAVPVIVTKHWRALDDGDICRLVECGAVLNTSISALDTPAELAHRRRQIARYSAFRGVSIARIVSCDFNDATPEGARMAAVQSRLFADYGDDVIDNPLRVPRTHKLVKSGTIRVRVEKDLESFRTISIAHDDAYVGHCDSCADKCGLRSCPPEHPMPPEPQLRLFSIEDNR